MIKYILLIGNNEIKLSRVQYRIINVIKKL